MSRLALGIRRNSLTSGFRGRRCGLGTRVRLAACPRVPVSFPRLGIHRRGCNWRTRCDRPGRTITGSSPLPAAAAASRAAPRIAAEPVSQPAEGMEAEVALTAATAAIAARIAGIAICTTAAVAARTAAAAVVGGLLAKGTLALAAGRPAVGVARGNSRSHRHRSHFPGIHSNRTTPRGFRSRCRQPHHSTHWVISFFAPSKPSLTPKRQPSGTGTVGNCFYKAIRGPGQRRQHCKPIGGASDGLFAYSRYRQNNPKTPANRYKLNLGRKSQPFPLVKAHTKLAFPRPASLSFPDFLFHSPFASWRGTSSSLPQGLEKRFLPGCHPASG